MKHLNILLVDDEHESRASLVEFLRDIGYEVTECANGADALQAFANREFHLVLSDIRMPRMSGTELLREIRSRSEDVDVVLFTGYGDMDSAIEALRLGAYDYLLKPVNIKELVSVAEQVAEHQALKRENKILNTKFEEAVQEAARDTREELSRVRKAYCQVAGIGDICVVSASMQKAFQQAQQLHANRSVPVLIEGETGTGKEVVARYIHYGDGDVTVPFIGLNCAAMASGISESEFFGYVPGVLGLPKGKRGKIDLAQNGTLFLDQVAELPVGIQAKLLRVIEEREFFRVGGLTKVSADVRIICATNADLAKQVDRGTFRSDLFYRLKGAYIYLPPLRERKDDILPLVTMFLARCNSEQGKRFTGISKSAADILLSYEWPGNVRELKNIIELVVLMWDEHEVLPAHLDVLQKAGPAQPEKPEADGLIDTVNFSLPSESLPLREYTDRIIRRALEMYGGNKTRTAKYLGMSRRSLDCRLKHLDS